MDVPEECKLEVEGPLQSRPGAAECNDKRALCLLALIAITQQQGGAHAGPELAQGTCCHLLVNGRSLLHNKCSRLLL